uniref:Uncharacterized protein n=1 Tax=Nothobranchius korthausae TaxID=1143690 RepID=A0A1A8FFL8_9TELE
MQVFNVLFLLLVLAATLAPVYAAKPAVSELAYKSSAQIWGYERLPGIKAQPRRVMSYTS